MCTHVFPRSGCEYLMLVSVRIYKSVPICRPKAKEPRRESPQYPFVVFYVKTFSVVRSFAHSLVSRHNVDKAHKCKSRCSRPSKSNASILKANGATLNEYLSSCRLVSLDESFKRNKSNNMLWIMREKVATTTTTTKKKVEQPGPGPTWIIYGAGNWQIMNAVFLCWHP